MKTFEDAVGTIARDFDIELDDIRCKAEFAHATADLDVPGREVKKDTVAGLLVKWQGVVDGVVIIELVSQWILSPQIDPPWEVAMACMLEIEGTPNLSIRVDILPDLDGTVGGLVETGMIMPALPTINAIPGVVAARPGIITFKDLPPVASVIRPNAARSARSQYSPAAPASAAASTALPDWSTSAGRPGGVGAPRFPGIRGIAVNMLERAATRIRGKSATVPMGAPGTFDGTWHLVIRTPGKAVESTLVVEKTADGYVGTQTAEGAMEPIIDVAVEEHMVTWGSKLTKPMRLKVKAGLFGSFPFTATKEAQ
jgi:hypothetical protein